MYFIQQLHLFFCRLLHGVSSPQYQEVIKKYSQRKKEPQKLTLCFNNETLLHFDKIIQMKDSFPNYQTSIPINMDGIRFGEDLKKIIQIKGEANCINNDTLGEENIHVNGYREFILGKQVKILFFTCREKFFFGEYLFNNGLKEIQQPLAELILKKYQITVADVTELSSSFYIRDDAGALLCFYDDGFSLFIKYYHASLSPVHEFLLSEYKVKNSNEKELNTKALENRL